MTRVLALPFMFAALLLGTPASASEPMIVAPAQTEGDLEDVVRDRLEVRLRDTIAKANVDIVRVPTKHAQDASACADARCRADLLVRYGAKYLLVPTLGLSDHDYRLGLTLYGPSGAEIARIEQVCGLCGLAEAADLVADLGARVGRKLAVVAQASSVTVVSDPPGASLYVGDELVGTTPFVLPLAAGAHELAIELDGYIGLVRTVEVVAGEANTVTLALQPIPDGVGRDRARARRIVGVGWGALGLGLATTAAGATLIALDHQPVTSECAGTNIDVEGNCRWRHATLEPGVGLLAGGVALVGVGVALLVIGRKRAGSGRSNHALRLRPSPAGVALQF